MITQILKQRIAGEGLKLQLVQGTAGLIAALVFVTGFRKVTELELTEAQMLLGFGIVASVVLQCFILWVLVDLKRDHSQGKVAPAPEGRSHE